MSDRFDDMDPVALLEEVRKLDRRINNPITDDFVEGVRVEAAHQVERWGIAHDRGKTPFDWFWLVGYLAQKVATSAVAGDRDKALHHTISTAAALRNWHASMLGDPDAQLMRPGTSRPWRSYPDEKPLDGLVCYYIVRARRAREHPEHRVFAWLWFNDDRAGWTWGAPQEDGEQWECVEWTEVPA